MFLWERTLCATRRQSGDAKRRGRPQVGSYKGASRFDVFVGAHPVREHL